VDDVASDVHLALRADQHMGLYSINNTEWRGLPDIAHPPRQ
jgi:hypothetical protein